VNLEEENIKLKMEIITLIMGYENELTKFNREEISDFSKSCMERYFKLIKDIKGEKK
jgi:hypothetical protein